MRGSITSGMMAVVSASYRGKVSLGVDVEAAVGRGSYRHWKGQGWRSRSKSRWVRSYDDFLALDPGASTSLQPAH
jgi:hypothetical protein